MSNQVKATLDLIETNEKGQLVMDGFTAIFDVSTLEDGSVKFWFNDKNGGSFEDSFSSKEEAIAYLDNIKAFIEAN